MKKLVKKRCIILICIALLLLILALIVYLTIYSNQNSLLTQAISDYETTELSNNNIVIEEAKVDENINSIIQDETQMETTEQNSATITKTTVENTNKKSNQTTVAQKETSVSTTNKSEVQPNVQTSTTTQDTIKRISNSEFETEKQRYLNDIKSVRPGLKYVYSKRGYVFWPYRLSEISNFVGAINFGTVYYYVEKFTENNQEKFKYYIDWEGN